MSANKPSEDSLRKMLDIQWQDHFQTRTQTWKALEVTTLLAAALVVLDWQVNDRLVTIFTSILILFIAELGISVTLKHRAVEITKFRIITMLENQLGIADENLQEILSNVVDRVFEGGDPGGQINGYQGLGRLKVSANLEAILEADPRAH